MLQLTTPLSQSENDVLLQCLTEQENHILSKSSPSSQDMMKRTAILSAKQKVKAQNYDCFYREEITNMVFALDILSRQCSKELSDSTSVDDAAAIGITLRTAASVRSKLRHAVRKH